MRRLHRTVRAPFAWLALLVLAVPLVALRRTCRARFAYYEAGDLDAPRPGPRAPAMMLMGGGEWVPEAFHWWLKQAGNGRVLILRASGSDELQDRLYREIGGTTAVQTLVFDSRRGADDPAVLRVVAAADAIFIAGGDQSRYIRFWKGTALNRALNAHAPASRLPVPALGSPSGGYAYGAMDGGSITSAGALADPMGSAVTMDSGFLQMPYLQRVVTDTHFDKRDRLGRLIVFVARAARTVATPASSASASTRTPLCAWSLMARRRSTVLTARARSGWSAPAAMPTAWSKVSRCASTRCR